MLVQSVGEKLRQARVRKGLQVSDLELLTGIDSHCILIMELDQCHLLPEDKRRSYVTMFAETVGLDVDIILEQWDAEQSGISNLPYNHLANDTDIEESNLFTGSVRPSRRQRRQPKKSSKGLVLLLAVASLLVLLFGAYRFWPTIKTYWQPSAKPKVTQVTKPGSSPKIQEVTEPAPLVDDKPKATIALEGEGNHVIATVTTSHMPVTVSFALEEADSSWVALTNSDLGEAGVLLNPSQSTYETALWEGTTTALISLGVSQGLTVKVNDVPLDLAPFTTGDVLYITLVLSSDANAHQDNQ